MSRFIARLALCRSQTSVTRSSCWHTHRRFSSQSLSNESSQSINQTTNSSTKHSHDSTEVEIEEPVKKVRVRRSLKPKIQPFGALSQAQSTNQSTEQPDSTNPSSDPSVPKRKRGRPRKQPAAAEPVHAQQSSDATPSQSSVTPVKRSVIPSRRVIRKPSSFDHAPRAPFGVQDVLTLLYTYLPAPHTAAHSNLPHPVQIYDVHSRSIFNNFVITVFCTSARQMSYLAQAVYKLARARDACPHNKSILSLERHKATDWQMVDMGPVMLHVFNVNATITQPSLDFHPSLPEPVQHRSSRFRDDEYDEREPQIPEPEREAVILQRHPVVDALERQFSDCLVPVERHLSLKDYNTSVNNEEGDQHIVEIQ